MNATWPDPAFTKADLQRRLEVARGEAPAHTVLRNGRIVNVLAGELHGGDIAVVDGLVAGIGSYEGDTVIDLDGAYVAPGFIDGHIHIESSMLTVPEFARAVVPHGTAAVVTDPHEFANVAGTRGIDYILQAGPTVPLDVFVMIPSCVPATHLETSGARLTVADMAPYLAHPMVRGVAEMMNFPGAFLGWDAELEKIALGAEKTVDGHSPGLTGNPLNAYIFAGIASDHECTTRAEAGEKLRRGMHILIREGTAERNLHELLPLVTPLNAANVSFATDDKHPADLEDEGHIDHHIRCAIAAGMDPLLALQIASIHTARHYGLRRHGAIAPGCWANLVVFRDLREPRPELVFHRGTLVAENGRPRFTPNGTADHSALLATMHVRGIADGCLALRAEEGKRIRVIVPVPRQIVTEERIETPLVRDGLVASDVGRDILKIAVLERHNASGSIGIGFVHGFGLAAGALASTVAHDAHNIIVVGSDDADMEIAARHLADIGGGQCVAAGGAVRASLPLPVAGLVSDRPLHEVRAGVDALHAAAAALGCPLPDPFMTLSFLALSPIPALKVTDLGLVDSVHFRLTNLFVSEKDEG